MQISRLFEIVYILLNQKKTTTRELAARFEVSKRTILRDIDTLSQAGIPIYTSPGKGGGISLLDHFVLNKAVISDDDQNQILFALQSMSSAEHVEVADTLSKMQLLFNKADTNWIEADFSRWGNSGTDKDKFETLKQAITNKKALAFHYVSAYGETAGRTVYPLKLVFKSKAWYLQAFCLLKEDYRTFKINRMLSIELLEESFAEKKIALPPPIDEHDMVNASLIHLILKFSRHTAYRLYDEFDTENVVENSDGSFTVTIDMPESQWLYSFLLSFGASVKVIEPRYVQQKLMREVEKINYLNEEFIK